MIRLLDWLRRQRRATMVLIAVAVGAGVGVTFHMSAGILPEVTFPRVTVIADSGEQPAEEMVRAVTRPLESALRRVPGLREIRSTTSRGSTEIQLDFTWRTDMRHALQGTQAAIDDMRESLPPGTSVASRLMSPALFPIVGLALMSPTRSVAEMRDLAVMRLQPELARLPGVAEVQIQGGGHLEARVTLDPAALEARRIDVETVAAAIRGAAQLEPVGLLDANGELYLSLADARPRDLETLGAVPVPVEGGTPVPLGTLARISLEPAPEYTRYVAGPGDAVLVSLLRQPTANTVSLAASVRDWLRRNRSQIPPDVRVETFYDQSDLVRASVDSVRDSLLIGSLLAIGAVILFLRSARLGLWAALLLPGSIALTLAGLALAHQTLNIMTLGGIAAAVGLVLDDAIVVVEHVAHRAAQGESRTLPVLAEVLPDLVGSSLCTISIFVPFMGLGGVTGAFFRVLALSMSLMLGSSLLLCVLVGPWLASRAGPARAERHRAGDWFGRLGEWAMRRRALAIGALAVLILAVVPLRLTLGSGFLPEMDEGCLILDYWTPPGSALAETDRTLRVIEREIARTPEIVAWSRRTGDQLGFFITEPNTGDYTLRLRERRQRSADEIADDLRERIGRVQPALEIEFGQLIEDVVGDLTTVPEPIEVRILGEDRVLDEQRAAQVAGILETVRGVVDARSHVVVSGSNLALAPGPVARRAGLTAEDLAARVSPVLQGVPVGQIARGARVWPVRLVLPAPPPGRGPDALADARVPFVSGRWARLGDVAELHVEPGETEIARDNLRTMASVTARLSGRDMGSAMREIQARLGRELVLGPGMTVQYAGLWAEQQSSFRELAAVLAAAAAAVLLVLLVAFRSWSRAASVLLVAAGSLAGVLAALHVGGATFNISSFVGAIMVVGIVGENAYFLVAAYGAALGRDEPPEVAAVSAARRRLRPVLMTTAAGVAALLPLALGAGGRAALLRPLALAVIGGFATSALLLLMVLPVLLAATGGRRD